MRLEDCIGRAVRVTWLDTYEMPRVVLDVRIILAKARRYGITDSVGTLLHADKHYVVLSSGFTICKDREEEDAANHALCIPRGCVRRAWVAEKFIPLRKEVIR